jgi:peptidoglycan/xylan/chitin deacetylase (PgdA/CDA1 family)
MFDPQELCVSCSHFSEHLEILRTRYRLLSLTELVDAARTRTLKKGTVAITFDDGYLDNLAFAKPLLERHRAPATVFAVSGGLESGMSFWWDRLERAVLWPGRLPEVLSLTIGGQTLQFPLGRWAQLDREQFELLRGWTVSTSKDPTPRHTAYREIWQRLRVLPNDAREELLRSLESNRSDLSPLPGAARSLSTDELRELADSAFIEIGAHTVHHEVLAALPPGRQRNEIEDSRNAIAAALGRPVRTFSFPYGTPSDYTSETVRLVREAGFVCACANFHGLVRHGADAFQLPRVLVRDWDGDGFARRLRIWIGG